MVEAECQRAYSMSKNEGLFIIFCIKLCLAILGLAFMISFIYRHVIRRDHWLAHVNCRILVNVHLFWAVEIPVAMIPALVYEIVRHSKTYADPCEALISVQTSVHLKMPYLLGIFSQILSMLSICIERAIAAKYPTSYEKITSSKLAIGLTIVSVLLGFFMTYGLLLFPITSWGQYTSVLSVKRPETTKRNQHLAFFLFCIEALCIVLLTITLFHTYRAKNWFNKKRVVDIGNKYQVSENELVLERLLPVCVFHFIIMAINMGGYPLYTFIFSVHDQYTYVLYTEFINLGALYSLFMPIIIDYKKWQQAKRRVYITKNQKQEDYFNQLKDYFEKGSPAV